MLPPSAGAVPLRTPYANGTVDGHRCSRRQLNAARTTTETWNITIATSIASEPHINCDPNLSSLPGTESHLGLAGRLDVPGNPWIGHNARDGANSAAVQHRGTAPISLPGSEPGQSANFSIVEQGTAVSVGEMAQWPVGWRRRRNNCPELPPAGPCVFFLGAWDRGDRGRVAWGTPLLRPTE
jgi:hypothetical protein